MKKGKALLALLICYLIWGMQPLYWSLLSRFSAMFILCVRVVMGACFTVLYLACAGRLGEFSAAFRNRRLMKYLVPAAVFIGCDWGIFIWAATSGHVLDTSLGYYLNPMVIFLAGVLVFRERGHALEYAAVAIACAGVIFSAVEYGSFPLTAALCATFWPIYASIKKAARADPIVSVAVESSLLSPLAVIYALLCCRGAGGFASVTWGSVPLLILSGVVTALPMVLYTSVVNRLPFKVVGILQYAGTTITFFCGVLFMHESLTPARLVMFVFIWIGLAVFTVGSFLRQRAGTQIAEGQEK